MSKDLETIKSIERAYGIELKQRLDLLDYDDVGYNLDADGKVVALSLYDCEIIDVTPLSKLTQLTELYLDVAFRTIVNGFIKGLRFFLVPLEHNLTRSSTV